MAAEALSVAEFFADHTFRMVFFGTAVIGLVAAALGSFAYLRKQSLISDVISHAALPGTLGAFLIAVTLLGVNGRSMVVLMTGAIVAGSLAVAAAQYVTRATKLSIDAAMALTLSLFFGAGMLLMRVIANHPFPGKGGVQDYLFGNASVITRADLIASISVGALALVLMIVFWKEFTLRTFDPDHASVAGFSGRVVDGLMFTTIVIAIVIGVKAVGLVLMVAFVVTPPAAARQWTRTLPAMVALAGAFGAVGSGLGAYLSIAVADVPTGPLIVLTQFAILVVSLLCAPRRSVVLRAWGRVRQRRRLRRDLDAERRVLAGAEASAGAGGEGRSEGSGA
ncbi:MAG TPA: metal ABC transporter permease [Actinomycetaceae bacterium]|nr:metal ABC transporter permease [Actinomycetaceae bacterium]